MKNWFLSLGYIVLFNQIQLVIPGCKFWCIFLVTVTEHVQEGCRVFAAVICILSNNILVCVLLAIHLTSEITLFS